MAPAAAQNTAALLALRRCVAFASLRTERAQRRVRGAERGRVLRVDEIHLARWFDRLSFGDKAVAVVAGDHFRSTVKALLQTVADLAEGGHPSPAGFQGARAGEAVTFAVGAHVVFDGLKIKEHKRDLRFENVS